jgi:hypothetical protein
MRVLRLAFIVLLIGSVPAPALSESPAPYATAADVIGSAQLRVSTNPDKWTPLHKGDRVPATYAVQTGANAAVLLSLPGQHVIRVGENTTLQIKDAGQNNAYSFSLLKGRIWSYVDKATKPAKYEVETASVILGVSGTLFSVAHDGTTGELDASVEDGEVLLRKGKVQKALDHGFQLRVLNGYLARATPHAHTVATRTMWKTVGTAEAWSKPGGLLRLNRQVDESARAVVQERIHERAGGRGRGRGRGDSTTD